MIRVVCPNPECKKVSRLAEEHAGRRVRCRGCGNVFTAKPQEEPGRGGSSQSANVITVVARRVGITRATDAGAHNASTAPILAASTIQHAPAKWRFGGLMVAALALVLPMALATGFVGWWLGFRPAVLDLVGARRGGTYGAIEITSTGVNLVVFQLHGHQEHGYDFSIVVSRSQDTMLTKDLTKAMRFDREALDHTVSSVKGFCEQLSNEHGLAREKIYIVSSEGILQEISRNKDLAETSRKALLAENKAALSDAVEQATGRAVEFFNISDDVKLQFATVVPERDSSDALLIDIGRSGTRGGYYDRTSNLFHDLKLSGTARIEDQLKASSTALATTARTAAGEFRAELRKQLDLKPLLAQRKKIYLNGGIVWVLATTLHPAHLKPEVASPHVKLSASDLRQFWEMVLRDPKTFPAPELPGDADPAWREAVKEVQDRQNRAIRDPLRLIAGAEILRVLDEELNLAKKEVYYTRYGNLATVLTYVAEREYARQ